MQKHKQPEIITKPNPAFEEACFVFLCVSVSLW